MAKTYSVKGKIPREVAQAVAEELVAALPDTQIVGSLRVKISRCVKEDRAT
jgi:hypothetical protein